MSRARSLASYALLDRHRRRRAARRSLGLRLLHRRGAARRADARRRAPRSRCSRHNARRRALAAGAGRARLAATRRSRGRSATSLVARPAARPRPARRQRARPTPELWRYLPHLPLEWLALALPAAAWLDRAPTTPPDGARSRASPRSRSPRSARRRARRDLRSCRCHEHDDRRDDVGWRRRTSRWRRGLAGAGPCRSPQAWPLAGRLQPTRGSPRLRLRFRRPALERPELGSTSKDQHPAGPQPAPGGAPWPPATSTASCSPATSRATPSCAPPSPAPASAACGSRPTRAARQRRRVGRQAQLLQRHRLGRPGRELRPLPHQGPRRLRSTGAWTGASGRQDGHQARSVEIVADAVQFLGSRDDRRRRRRAEPAAGRRRRRRPGRHRLLARSAAAGRPGRAARPRAANRDDTIGLHRHAAPSARAALREPGAGRSCRCTRPTAAGCSCGDADCASPGKHPRTRDGVHDASTPTASRSRRWWARWPDANVAIATGVLVVLDVDGDRRRAIARRAPGAATTPLPSTAWVADRRAAGTCTSSRSARDDRQLRRPARARAWTSAARGGYVVAPPSLTPRGHRYRWHGLRDGSRRCPAWLADALTRRRPARAAAPRSARWRARRRVRAAPRWTGELERIATARAGHPQRHAQPRRVPARAARRRRPVRRRRARGAAAGGGARRRARRARGARTIAQRPAGRAAVSARRRADQRESRARRGVPGCGTDPPPKGGTPGGVRGGGGSVPQPGGTPRSREDPNRVRAPSPPQASCAPWR